MDFLDELGLHQLWEKIKGLISSQTSNYAVDSAVVHIAGSETVTGPKTFSGGVTVASGAVISGGAEVNGRFAISSGGADFEIPSGDPNDATKFLRGDGAWAEITSAASADTITTTLPISLGGTGESTKNMAVSALFNDNVGSNAAYLLGATSTFASAGYVDANDAKALLGITQSDIVSRIGTEPVASASAATDAASLGGVAASNYVTLNTDQNITGIKTFVGQKKIKFQQSGASDKLGFTLYNSAGVEQGYLEYNPTNKINGAPLMTLGNYASAAAGVAYVGFRKYSNITGSAGAYNLLTPLIADAKTPFSLTTTYSNFFLPLGVTDGTSMVTTDSSGVLDISPILPSGYTLPPATTTSIGGVAIGSGLDVTSTGDISVDSAYVSSAALDAVSSGGYIVTSDAAAIIADQISSGGYVTSTGTVASAGVADGLTATADSGYVHISGDEAISGGKTFVGNLGTSGANPIIQDTDSTWDITATSRSARQNKLFVAALDKNGYRIGGLEVSLATGGDRDIHYTMRNRANTGWINDFNLYENASGIPEVLIQNNAKFNKGITVTSDSVISGKLTVPNLELWGTDNNGGYVDFHWNSSTADYTARIIEQAQGTLGVKGRMIISGAGTSATATGLEIKGNGSYQLALCNTGIIKGTAPSANQYVSLEFTGSAHTAVSDRLGFVEHKYTAGTKLSTMQFVAYGGAANNTTTACTITCNVDSAGNAYTTAPTPATGDSSTKIATTAFVRGATVAVAGSCTGNAATATKASSCTGNAATATKASSCTGNAATATNADNGAYSGGAHCICFSGSNFKIQGGRVAAGSAGAQITFPKAFASAATVKVVIAAAGNGAGVTGSGFLPFVDSATITTTGFKAWGRLVAQGGTVKYNNCNCCYIAIGV